MTSPRQALVGQVGPLLCVAAVAGGMSLGLGSFLSDPLARYTGTLWASLVAQAVGAVAASAVAGLLLGRRRRAGANLPTPWWSYLGGVPGAFTIFLASITTQSEIGLAGTLALMLLGQVTFGLAADLAGLMAMPRRQPTMLDFFGVLTIMTGSAVIIFFAG